MEEKIMTPARRYHQNWISGIFDDFFDNSWMVKAKATAPAINVLEDEKSYTVEVAAPGMTKEDFNVHIDDDHNLVISMEKQTEAPGPDEEKKDRRYLRREFSYSKFQQTLILPDDVDKEGIKAQVQDGVLSVTLPRLTPEQKCSTLKQRFTDLPELPCSLTSSPPPQMRKWGTSVFRRTENLKYRDILLQHPQHNYDKGYINNP